MCHKNDNIMIKKGFQIILRELGLLGVMNTESNKGIKFVRRIGERMKVGFMFNSLNRIPDLQHISIGNDLTEMQRKEENTM